MTSEAREMKRSIKVVVKEPGQSAQVRQIKNSTAAMQAVVASVASRMFGVYLSPIFDEKRGLALVTDNVARRFGLPNLNLKNDVVMGTAIIVRRLGEGERQQDLTDEQVAMVLAWCERADHRHDPSRRPKMPRRSVVKSYWDRSEDVRD